MYCKAAGELTGPLGLDDVVLNGTLQSDPSVTYNSGYSQTPSFTPFNHPAVQFPAIDLAMYTYQSKDYIFTVNSAEGTSNATITGLTGSSAKVLFEGRTVTISNGQLTDTWDENGVHIYMIE
jgi:hypothetical protein